MAHWIGNDLSESPTGDILTVDGIVRGQQRVLRRLMTVAGTYIFHNDYGAGLPLYVGRAVSAEEIEAVIRSQIHFEAAVARIPQPEIIVNPIPLGVYVRILYSDAETGTPTTLSFDVTE